MAAVLMIASWVVSAAPAAAFAEAHSTTQLQPLVNDTVAQLEIAYRHDRAELERRYNTVGQAVSAYKKSSRDAANHQRLAEWLRAVMRASMPGAHEALPPIPEFESAPVKAEDLPQPTSHPPARASSTSPVSPAAIADPPTGDQVETPSTNAANSHVKPMETPTAQTVETHKPVVVDEGDPFRDDPLPNEGTDEAFRNGSALPSGH
jgi:hypothetical protein